MNGYWKSHYDLISSQFDGSLLKQVGKTVNGREVPESQVKLIVHNIASVLQLSANDTVIDLCCGNGLITRKIAPLVEKVFGVDYTFGLIETAKTYNSFHNIEYINSDILSLDPDYYNGFNKILMYEALQHFYEEQLVKLLDVLSTSEAGSLFFLGSIPNKEKLNEYYDTEEKYAFYMHREREGKPHIGRWWLKEEIEQIASNGGFKAMLLQQEPTLYTAYYRFDVLLERCS